VLPGLQGYDVQEKEGAVLLLAALAPLTNLKKLDLTDILLEPLTVPHDGFIDSIAPRFWIAAPAAEVRLNYPFSALTASSVLESLTLAYRSPGYGDDPVQPLPMGAVAAMFPPGRQLTALTGDGLRTLCGMGLQWCTSHFLSHIACLGYCLVRP
jgi:hypothetical protein